MRTKTNSGAKVIYFLFKINMKKLFYILFCFAIGACSGEQKSQKEEKQETKTDSVAPKKVDRTNYQTILFFGNSLTAGFGLETSQAFPALIQDKIDSLNLPYNVLNAGLSGETTSSGKNRLDWMLKQKIDVFILELGGNDGLRGIDPAETLQNMKEIVTKLRAKYPEVRIVLAGMEVPPNMGEKYASEFRKIYPEIAKEYNLVLIPFLLEGVGGDPSLNLPDGIHPTAEGHKIVAKTVWKYLEKVL